MEWIDGANAAKAVGARSCYTSRGTDFLENIW